MMGREVRSRERLDGSDSGHGMGREVTGGPVIFAYVVFNWALGQAATQFAGSDWSAAGEIGMNPGVDELWRIELGFLALVQEEWWSAGSDWFG